MRFPRRGRSRAAPPGRGRPPRCAPRGPPPADRMGRRHRRLRGAWARGAERALGAGRRRDARVRAPAPRGEAAVPGGRHALGRRPCRDRGRPGGGRSAHAGGAGDVLQPPHRRRERDDAQFDRRRRPRALATPRPVARPPGRPITASGRRRGNPPVGVVDHVQPPHRDPRRRVPWPRHRRGREGHLVVGVGQPGRGRFRRAVVLRRAARPQPAPHLRPRESFLPGCRPRPARDPDPARRVARPLRRRRADGPIEFTRSNKHLGVRHMPVRLHARNGGR